MALLFKLKHAMLSRLPGSPAHQRTASNVDKFSDRFSVPKGAAESSKGKITRAGAALSEGLQAPQTASWVLATARVNANCL
jgi:hypothetical protein